MTFVTPGIDSQGRVIITSRGTTYKINLFDAIRGGRC